MQLLRDYSLRFSKKSVEILFSATSGKSPFLQILLQPAVKLRVLPQKYRQAEVSIAT
jgi:hypothetical protein